ncbi:MAG TPA: SGNH/GDSL hydrolase family protein, partial [Bacteroidia bacterium]|nr:SGNH/GDSL hydrolase family protein [Bacteroidia bacterium]
MGLRDKEYTDAKPPHTQRWAFTGGSYVLGPGVEKEQTFEAIVEEQLNDSLRKAGADGLEILNFSNGGYLLPQTVELCRNKIFKYDPDYVFYFAHPGELAYTPKNISRLLAFGVDLKNYQEFQKVIDETGLKQTDSRIEMMRKMEPYQEELLRWGYKEITDDCRKHNAQPVWVFFPTTTDGDTHAEFLQLSKIASEYGFLIIDLSNVYAGYKVSDIQNSEVDTHPNALGHKLIARKLESEIRKKILVPSNGQTIPPPTDH